MALEQLQKHLEAAGCTQKTWKNLLGCNLPIPLLDKALRKDIIPQNYAKAYFGAIKENEQVLENKGFKPIYLIFSGDIGNYKTLMAVRFMVIKTINLNAVPLFLTNDELVELYEGRLELHQYVDDITFATTTELKARGVRDGYTEIVPFTAICRYYKVILVDDLEESGLPALERLILHAYNHESYLIVTTNISPPQKLTELLDKKAVSRLRECGTVLHVQGADKRGGER